MRLWRTVNTGILLFALFGPWVPGCNSPMLGMETKAEPLKGYDFVYIAVVGMFSPAILNPLLIVFIGFLLYIAFNTYNIISPSSSHKFWLILFLMLSISWFIFVGVIFNRDLQKLLWGYWLTCTGLLSGLGLEIFNYKTLRKQGDVYYRSPPYFDEKLSR